MIKFLSDLGRGFVILGAFVAIFSATLAGYEIMPDIFGLTLGFLGGCIISGIVFGAVATLYDIRDNIRVLVERDDQAPPEKFDVPPLVEPRRDELRAS